MVDGRGRAASSTQIRNERSVDAGPALNTAAAHSSQRDAPTRSTPQRALAAQLPSALWACAVTRTGRRGLCAAAPPAQRRAAEIAIPATLPCEPEFLNASREPVRSFGRPAARPRARAPSSSRAGFLRRDPDASAGQFGRRSCGRPAGRRPARNPARGVSGPPRRPSARPGPR
jgi:hypothetical protein